MDIVAAIDVGSNAVRTVIAVVKDDHELVVLKKSREPLRLGEDVFSHGSIGHAKIKQAEDIFLKIKDQLKRFQVDRVKAVATSAMRDAKNGDDLRILIEHQTGITIEAIDGDTEAKLIHEAVHSELDLSNKLAVFVDIGGGSTEFTISKNKQLIACRSFNIGAVRLLEHSDLNILSSSIAIQMLEVKIFLDQYIKNQKIDALVGTGGNFRRLGKINKKITGKNTEEYLTLSEIESVSKELQTMSHKDRVKKFEISDDRADVIIPAADLIRQIVVMLKMDGVFLPKVGLKDGILLSMLAK